MKPYDIKGIMLGLGIGLVFSAIINININEKDLSDDYIKTEAIKRGFIVINPEDIINKEIKNEEAKDDEKTETEEAEKEEVKIEIIKGSSSYDVAELLMKSGLILNSDEFLNRLRELDKERKIQYGNYIIKKGTNYDDIIDIITIP